MSEVRDTLIFEGPRKTDPMFTQGEIPNTGGSKNSKRRKVFGRSLESNASLPQENGEVSTPISITSTKRSSVEDPTLPPRTHRRAKKSLDNTKPTDRLSLFGSISGSLGKSRKPPPRYSGGYVFVENPPLIRTDGSEPNRSTDKEDDGAYGKVEREKSTGSTFSRLYHIGERKPSVSKHNVGELTARQAALDRSRSQADSPTKLAKEDKDRALLRKRTSGGETPKSPAPAPPSNASGLVQGRSVLEQIGTPDFNGWLMKKGEHYNTWKQRYCVLKGHNLYWMRTSDNTVRGDFLVFPAEANFDARKPRSKGISTFLVTRSLPTRISSQETTVSGWNIRTTRPTCSIRPPNPLSESG